MSEQKTDVFTKDYSRYDFHDEEEYDIKIEKGLSQQVVRDISKIKKEPSWMLDIRLQALDLFWSKPMPSWGPPLSAIDFQDIYYYLRPTGQQENTWEEVPEKIKNTFERLGIPEAERKFLAGVGAQYESESVYHKIRDDLTKHGVIFLDMDSGLREHPNIIKKFFGTIIPAHDNKFSALNTAVWSGGSFIYVPAGVKVDLPLQAYFRINAQNMGQFERTLIITEPDAYVHYIEGCSAPVYSTNSLHTAVVELLAMERSKIRYTTIQNWSNNIYNLVTKRAVAHAHARVEWIDGNLGSKVTMKYPGIILKGEHAHGDVLSIAFAGEGQCQDAGAKITHAAPNTTSTIISKSVSKDGGRTTYRGLVRVFPHATNVKSHVVCDALILDEKSSSDTVPYMEIGNNDVSITHEATVSKINEAQLFYLMSRGIPEQQAMAMIVGGFIEPFVKELPLEYAVELNRLIQLEMTGAVG